MLANGTTYINTTSSEGPNSVQSTLGSSTPTGSTSATASASAVVTTDSGGLSTGAKAGIGVGIALVVILAVVVGLLLVKHKRKRLSNDKNRAPQSYGEKPELEGSAYDGSTSGPVKPKSELDGGRKRLEIDSESHISATQAELLSNTSQGRSNRHNHELIGSIVGAELAEGRTGQPLPVEPDHLSSPQNPQQCLESEDTRDDVGLNFEQKIAGDAEVKDTMSDEADLLVQELGLIKMRKKGLINNAAAQGLNPEDVPGAKGEDFRELVERENKLRSRIEEMDKMRECT